MGFDLFSIGNNGVAGTFESGMEGIVHAPSNAAAAEVGAANTANQNDQQMYQNTYANMSPYMTTGFDATNMMRQMVGMAPLSSSMSPSLTAGNSGFSGASTQPVQQPTHRASGGPTYPGSFVVGEHGPEILHMYPGSKGYVEPNSPKANNAAYGPNSYPGRAAGGTVTGAGLMPNGAPTYQQALANQAARANPTTPAAPTMSTNQILKDDPSYKFQLSQGLGAVQAGNLATGGGLSGRQVKGAEGYAEGLASQDYSNIFNREATLAGMGESATGTVGELGMYTGMAEGNNSMYAGNANAAGSMAPWNSFMGAMGNMSSMFGAYSGSKG